MEAWAFYRGVELDSGFKVAAALAALAAGNLLNAAAIERERYDLTSVASAASSPGHAMRL